MSLIPTQANKIEVAGATVDFFKLDEDGQSTYYFDTSKCGPPEPMVNAMSGLKLIKGTDSKLVMINHKTPGGLFSKLGDDISHEAEAAEGGLVKVTFSSNDSSVANTDLNQNTCH
ncbi:MAG: hypothetical protein L3J19_06255 [Sulfurimonas sp.]|nr:hypothetical protein [Sulfurimonas sp.]